MLEACQDCAKPSPPHLFLQGELSHAIVFFNIFIQSEKRESHPGHVSQTESGRRSDRRETSTLYLHIAAQKGTFILIGNNDHQVGFHLTVHNKKTNNIQYRKNCGGVFMKKIVFGFLSCVIIFGACLSADDSITLRVKSEVANIRLKADINSVVVTRVNAGMILQADEKAGNWYRVEVDVEDKLFMGFIHESVVDVIVSADVEKRETRAKRVEPDRQHFKAEKAKKYSTENHHSGIMLHGGLSMASVTYPQNVDDGGYDIDENLKRKTGFLGGFSFDMGKQIGLEIGCFYIQKGAAYGMELEQGGTVLSIDGKMILDEISAPVLLKIRFSPGSTPFIVAGGEVAYVLSSKFDWTTEQGEGAVESGTQDLIEQTNRLDYGLIFGAGYELEMGGSSLVIQGRYHLGLADLAKQEADEDGATLPIAEENWLKTNAIVLMVGIKF